MTDYLKLAKEAFEASSTFVDANYRKDWEYSLRAFRNEHAPGSKYNSEEFKSRSHIFPPYTRSIIRKNEAAGATAFFSNMEIVNLTPGNPDNPMSVASRDALKEVLEYRLTKTIPWFLVCMGAIQDAQTQGAVCSYNYWKYEKRNGKLVKDQPCIELRPIENIRLDGGAEWLDPVGTSPYYCDIIPMYVCDVKGMMKSKDDKTGKPKWKSYEDDVIAQARPDEMDSTRKVRLGNQQDPYDEQKPIKSYDIVWVLRWFMKDSQGDDRTFYTLGTEKLLTDDKPIDAVYFHGVRPYTMGFSVLETHKVVKTSMPMLIKPLQQEGAEIRNQRLDNVKFVLNKRWLVARGRQVDVQSLVRNAPGGVTLTTDPKTDVVESNWPDVTSSAFVEQDRLKADIDELAGNFSANTKVANNAVNDTLGGSRLANQTAGVMTDYLLRTITESWIEPTLRQLIQLEAEYETDQKILEICGNKARLFPKYGLSRITDDMLKEEVNVTVNVGMGSSNPQQRMQNFLLAAQSSNQLILQAPPGANAMEMVKEVWSNAGYRDGARFYNQQQDPRLVKAMQMIEQMHQQMQGRQMELQADITKTQMQLQSQERVKTAELFVDNNRINGDLRIRESELTVAAQQLGIDQQKVDIERLKVQLEGHSKALNAELSKSQTASDQQIKTAQLALDQQRMELEKLKVVIDAHIKDMEQQQQREDQNNKNALTAAGHQLAIEKINTERQKLQGNILTLAQELEKGQQEIQKAMIEKDDVVTNSAVQNVTNAIGSIGEEIQKIRQQVEDGNKVRDMADNVLLTGIGHVAKHINEQKSKKIPKGLKVRKGQDNKTSGIDIQYNDGSTESVPVTR